MVAMPYTAGEDVVMVVVGRDNLQCRTDDTPKPFKVNLSSHGDLTKSQILSLSICALSCRK